MPICYCNKTHNKIMNSVEVPLSEPLSYEKKIYAMDISHL